MIQLFRASVPGRQFFKNNRLSGVGWMCGPNGPWQSVGYVLCGERVERGNLRRISIKPGKETLRPISGCSIEPVFDGNHCFVAYAQTGFRFGLMFAGYVEMVRLE